MLISLIMVLISQFIPLSKHRVVYLKFIQFLLLVQPTKGEGRNRLSWEFINEVLFNQEKPTSLLSLKLC